MSAAREKATTPATGQTETRFWLQLLSLHGELFAALNAAMIAELGLSLAKFDALAQLARYPDGLTLGRLTQNLKVSGGNVSGLVQRLAAVELISREMSNEDRRSFIVRLTPKGEAVFRKAAGVHNRHLRQRLEDVPTHELEAALSILRSISSKVRSEQKNQNRRT